MYFRNQPQIWLLVSPMVQPGEAENANEFKRQIKPADKRGYPLSLTSLMV
jgi:hypothetical protein